MTKTNNPRHKLLSLLYRYISVYDYYSMKDCIRYAWDAPGVLSSCCLPVLSRDMTETLCSQVLCIDSHFHALFLSFSLIDWHVCPCPYICLLFSSCLSVCLSVSDLSLCMKLDARDSRKNDKEEESLTLSFFNFIENQVSQLFSLSLCRWNSYWFYTNSCLFFSLILCQRR